MYLREISAQWWNGLAYKNKWLDILKKCFIKLAPGVDVIKLLKCVKSSKWNFAQILEF